MSTRPSRDWMNSCGIMARLWNGNWIPACAGMRGVLRSARQLCLYQRRYLAHVRASGESGFHHAHDFPHVGGGFRAPGGDGRGADGVDLGLREPLPQASPPDSDLEPPPVGQILPRAPLAPLAPSP